jgi:PAS domain S-box-containing protein
MTQATSEEQRLEALRAYGILDSEPEAAFDDLTRLAARICGAPMAVISLVDSERQWFKSVWGLSDRETARDVSVCSHTIAQAEPVYVIPDLLADRRFADGPLTASDSGLRFYAGALLTTTEGQRLGTLAVIDRSPRPEGLTEDQSDALATLARQVMGLLDLRRAVARLEDSQRRFRLLADTLPQMVWSTRPDGFHDYYNKRWYEFTGTPEGSTDGEGWNDMFHPEDQEHAWAVWRRSLETGEPYEIEYRLRHHSGEYRWTLGRALPIRDREGRIERWFGTCTDIHDHKRLNDQQALLSRELSHRIKNIFSVVSGLVALSARRFPDAADFARDLRERIVSLGRAHDFVRPQVTSTTPSHASLTALLTELLSPYGTGDENRIRIEGGDAAIDDQAATPIALVVHELATNAAKYGALSASEGRVRIRLERSKDALTIIWTEQGGPPVPEARSEGFGSTLSRISIENQLGGRIHHDWRAEGLEVTLGIPLAALSRVATATGPA